MQVLGRAIQQSAKELERSYKESMRQNQLDRIERNQQQILNNQNWNNFYQQPTKRGSAFDCNPRYLRHFWRKMRLCWHK